MRIRPADLADLPLLCRIARESKATWGYGDAQLDSWADELSPTADSIVHAPTFVAELEDEVAGFYQLDSSGEMVELAHFWIRPDRQRRGIGRALLRHVAALLDSRGIDALAIDADPHAEPFYVACGAARTGARPAPIPGQPDRKRPQLLLRIPRRTSP